MGLKIRLRSQGRRNHIVYRLVLTDARSPRDGKYLELLGSYDPHVKVENVKVDSERTLFWLKNGAELSEKAESLVKRAAPDVLAQWRREKEKTRAKRTAKRRARRKSSQEAAAV